jgi:hypothetical protein
MRRLVFAVIVGALSLTGCGTASPGTPVAAQVSTTGSATPVPTTTSVSRKATSPPSTKPPAASTAAGVIGPDGYGKIKLGMSYADVRASGAIKEDENASPGCNQYEMFTGGRSDGYVHISKERGVEAIGPILKVSTPEKVAVGATLAKVRAAYPAVEEISVSELGRGYTPVPGNPKAVYRIAFQNGAVETISLQLEDESCYE